MLYFNHKLTVLVCVSAVAGRLLLLLLVLVVGFDTLSPGLDRTPAIVLDRFRDAILLCLLCNLVLVGTHDLVVPGNGRTLLLGHRRAQSRMLMLG